MMRFNFSESTNKDNGGKNKLLKETKLLNYNKNSRFSESSPTAAAAEQAAVVVEHTARVKETFCSSPAAKPNSW